MKVLALVEIVLAVVFFYLVSTFSDNIDCAGHFYKAPVGYTCEIDGEVEVVSRYHTVVLPSNVVSAYQIIRITDKYVSYFWECYETISYMRYGFATLKTTVTEVHFDTYFHYC